jgi:aminocarboxymuconate-semialdehyde decarboxylase
MMHTCMPAARSASRKSASGARTVRDRKGRSLRIDLHCHYFNAAAHQKALKLDPGHQDPLVKYANAFTRETNAKQGRERAAMLSSIDTRLADMDRMGIDIQAISPSPNQTYYWAPPDAGLEIARDVNDRLAEIVASHPDRFVALGTIPLQDSQLAVRELDRCVNELGMRGVEINPNVDGTELTDARLGLEKFFARAEALGIVIFMHPIGYPQGERLVDHYFNNVIGNPLDTTVAASHLIFDGVMDRHPKLKLVLPHGGGYLAHYWARMDHAHRARPDCRTVIRKAPSSYLKKMYFDTITFDPRMLRQMLDVYGAEHVVLGTDYPYDMADMDPVGSIGKVPRLTRAERDLIEGGNAARLLKLKLRRRK